METTKVPYIIYAESTPNPATMKFVANQYLMPENENFESDDPNANEASPLAQSLFRFSFIRKIYITSNFISISRNEVIEWEDIVHQVREFIVDYLNKGGVVYKGRKEDAEDKKISESFTAVSSHKEARNETEKNIIAILDEYIKPAVENDGGAILFDSYDDGKVKLILKGSCSGCPSSVMTLKTGIENMLKQMMPGQVEEVIALNG